MAQSRSYVQDARDSEKVSAIFNFYNGNRFIRWESPKVYKGNLDPGESKTNDSVNQSINLVK